MKCINMGFNSNEPGKEEEFLEAMKQDGCCGASWGVTGRTMHRILASQLASKYPQYRFEIGDNYECAAYDDTWTKPSQRDPIERIRLVKAMEYVARQINDEGIFYNVWLTDGVADGDVQYGDLIASPEEAGDDWGMGWYIDDEHFADLMGTFLFAMAKAKRSGGLYCDGISSKP